MTEFVHLHNHTDYSLLDGAASAAKYAAKAKELGIKIITDKSGYVAANHQNQEL